MDEYTEIVNKEIDKIIELNIFGNEFKFTEGQRDVVFNICTSFLEFINGKSDIDSVVVYAPTGYGKSVIAMFTSKVLQRLKYSGYILTVDLMLQQQYENDFKRFNLNYHSIKGVDNYKCNVNSESFRNGECQTMNLSYKQLAKLECYPKCAYLQARNRAISATVSLLNYSYWLIQRNTVQNKVGEKDAPFKRRDYVFFDECHKIDNIVQNAFSIKINEKIADDFENLNELLMSKGYHLEHKIDRSDISELINNLDSDRKDILLETLKELKECLFFYTGESDTITDAMKDDVAEGEKMDGMWKRIFQIMDIFTDLWTKIHDYVNIVNEVGLRNLIKRKNEDCIEFLSLREDHLINKYLLEQSHFKIFMSATLGNAQKYAKIIGLKKVKIFTLQNVFNYDKSPIYIVKNCRLDYNNKKENMDKAIKLLDEIVATKHMNDNGIVHSGSFEFTSEILKKSKLKNKFISYDSSNKRAKVKKFLASEGKILIGPSILEGLDLYDELCRFQIFFKVPYPSLGDPLVRAKLDENEMWYSFATSVSIIQGVNRSIRHTEDYAITYVLDSCIIDLIKKKCFDDIFLDRLRVYEF